MLMTCAECGCVVDRGVVARACPRAPDCCCGESTRRRGRRGPPERRGSRELVARRRPNRNEERPEPTGGGRRATSVGARRPEAEGGLDHVLEGRAGLLVAAGLETAVGVHPQALRRHGADRPCRAGPAICVGARYLLGRVDVVHAGADGAVEAEPASSPTTSMWERAAFERDHVDVEAAQRVRGSSRTRSSTCGCGPDGRPAPAVARRKHSVAHARYPSRRSARRG